MITKQEALDKLTPEARLIEAIDYSLRLYQGNVIEICVEDYHQELLDKVKPMYEQAGWVIKQKNRRNDNPYGGSAFKRHLCIG